MAVALGPLVADVKEKITLDDLAGKTVAIDAYNTIYQFITIIRQPDGTPLMDSKGRITSHLSGLFYRTINFFEHRITPVYVFDGIPPALKRRTIEARVSRRAEALKEWNKSLEKGMLEEARTHAVASTRITKEIVESGKELLNYMGVAHVQAPSEGEAQAARMANDGLAYASASQDYDLFLFGSEVSIRNLTITGRRKLPRRNAFVEVTPERIELKNLLGRLGISRRQLVWLGMLMGTDFNEGIEGVGPKTALKIVRERKSLDDIVGYVKEKYGKEFDVDPYEVEDVFMKPDTIEVKKKDIDNNMKVNKDMLTKFMCDEHGFAHDRVAKFADTLAALKSKAGQKGIGSWV
ncbi:Flap endonuclease 1 [uncultured archaeon]|nr:Flap endonuclease 1 [uncultured archaeon]